MNKKIVISLFCSAIIVLVSLYAIMDLYLYIYDPSWRGITNEKHTINKPMIFIVGASNVYSINSTQVEKNLESSGIEYEIYNLADMSDRPSHRLQSINHLISLKPTMVLYGVSITDFENPYENVLGNSISLESKILQPKKFFVDTLSYFGASDLDFKFPTSPKDRMILSLRYLLKGPEFIHNPFINYNQVPITNKKGIESYREGISFRGIDSSDVNKEKLALDEIIKRLQKNNIKVALFTPPYHRIFFDSMTEFDDEIFTKSLRDIAEQNHIEVYFLHKKYKDMNIWRDPYHVAVNSTVTVYTDDISEILSQEIAN
jgi:hypothetical protein